ncbi:MAG TPA: two-component regulator propeller domain-containing protein [Bacteroidia bacterium]|nr:two-component regulator propeller domain-containing protein [Bacteroidia bacterium]
MLSLRQILLYSCVLYLLSYPDLSAQQYSFINYSIEDGLAQSQVQTIFQDEKGYLWMGTYGGLSRYDGKSFANYSKEDGLLDNRINCIVEGPNMALYFGTLGGINKFNAHANANGGQEKTFTSIALKPELSKNQVTAMAVDKQGNLWLCTDGMGVCRYNGVSFEYFNEKNGLINDYVRTVCIDKNGNAWFGTRGGICYYDGKQFVKIDPSIAQPHNVSQIIKDKDENLWFCTYGEGIFRYDPLAALKSGPETFTNYTEKDGLILNWIRSATQDASGNFWFASKSGVSKFDGNTFLNFNKSNGLFYPNINTVMQDKEGKVWFGTDGKGVMKFTGETFVNFTTHDGLSSDIIMDVTEDSQNNRWFCTYGNGVCKQDPVTKKFTNYTIADGLNNNVVWTCVADNNNNLWFGTSDGVCRYDGKRFIPLLDSLPAKIVYSIYQDSQGNMWFGTTAGVSLYDGKSCRNFIYGKDNIGRNIRCILEDDQHNMWFASSNGVYKYDPKGASGETFVNYTTENGLSDNNVVTIVQDRMHNLWIGTSNGITHYDPSAALRPGGKVFSGISIDEKYSANNVNFMLLDASQHLWLGTNNGIYELNTEAYSADQKADFKHYTNYEGLRSLECNQNAAYQDHDGNLWFGTSDGILKYSSSGNESVYKDPEPLTHITSVRLFLQPTDWSAFSDSVDPVTQLPLNLSIDYKKKYLTFDYIGISLNNPGAVRYRFMLEGFDQDWSPPTDATFATYSNLPHGKYTFKVIACNKDNVWNTVPATFSFEILPPFWLTWWFFALCFVFVSAIIWLVYRWRVSVIKAKHHTQQLEYKSRLLVLEHQTLNASMNRHFVFNALNSIQYYITKENKTLASKYLSSFAKLIRKNLDSSLSNFVPLSEEIERLKLYLELEHMRLENKFEYRIDIEGDIDTESIEIPPMMLQPYIENSIWHGILPLEKPGTVIITVKEVGDEIMFSIEDNGIGVEASKAKKAGKGEGHVSRGMEITNGRINLLRAMTNSELAVKGPFDVKNAQNETIGTRVEIVLPIKAYS